MPAIKGQPNKGQFRRGHDPKRYNPAQVGNSPPEKAREQTPSESRKRKQERIVRAFKHVMLRPATLDKTQLQKTLRVLFDANVKRFFDAMDAEEKKLLRDYPQSGESQGIAADAGTAEGVAVMDRLWEEFEAQRGTP